MIMRCPHQDTRRFKIALDRDQGPEGETVNCTTEARDSDFIAAPKLREQTHWEIKAPD